MPNYALQIILSFNTQPPEGGWIRPRCCRAGRRCFNTQPPEGGWWKKYWGSRRVIAFQHTAARRRLAAHLRTFPAPWRFQHTAARRRLVGVFVGVEGVGLVSTHSRPKAAGTVEVPLHALGRFQHTAARRRLGGGCFYAYLLILFQHTAARRRLAITAHGRWRCCMFQHTAARRRLGYIKPGSLRLSWFQHTAARRRLGDE